MNKKFRRGKFVLLYFVSSGLLQFYHFHVTDEEKEEVGKSCSSLRDNLLQTREKYQKRLHLIPAFTNKVINELFLPS